MTKSLGNDIPFEFKHQQMQIELLIFYYPKQFLQFFPLEK